MNITLLQASVVEAVISFSALENTKDLTCVSLVSVCIDDVNLQFSSGQQSNRSVQIVKRPPKLPGKQKKRRKSKNRQAVEILSQPVYIERCVKQREENMMSINIGRTHAQLRRLQNESTLLQDADITAIPKYRSKVLFSYQRCCKAEKDSFLTSHLGADKMGFIMFEAGLEKVALKAIKRKGFGSTVPKKDTNLDAEQEAAEKDADVDDDDDNASTSDNLSSPSTTINAEAKRNLSRSGSQNLGSSESLSAASSHSSGTSFKRRPDDDDVSSVGYSGGSEESGGNNKTEEEEKLPKNTGGAKSKKRPSSLPKRPSSQPPSSQPTASNQPPPDETKKTKNEDQPEEESSPPKGDDEQADEQSTGKYRKKDITSFSGEIRSVWLNFAAPPHTPITRKIDYTRLDWNLLSTASPSIDAWMNPSDRLAVAIGLFVHNSEMRRLAVMASLMTEALDVPSIHVPDKPRYWKVQPVSQTLLEDPSCQLCNVLRRYLLLPQKLEALEGNLAPSFLPKLATLRQAIIVLSRQWKNVLYIPSLMERTVKHQQPGKAHVKFKLSTRSSTGKTPVARSVSASMSQDASSPSGTFPSQGSMKRSPGTLGRMEQQAGSPESSGPGDDGTEVGVSSGSTQLPPKPNLPSYPMTSSRASVVFPIRSPHVTFNLPKLSTVTPNLSFFKAKSPPPEPEPKIPPPRPPPARRTGPAQQASEAGPLLSPDFRREESDSEESDENEHPMSDGSLSFTDKHHDLYTWMANQEDNRPGAPEVPFTTEDFMPPMHSPQKPSKPSNAGILSDGEGNESPQELGQGDQFFAAHVIFAPLLSSIGVQTQQAPARALEQLGPNVCVLATVEGLRVHIAESEIKSGSTPSYSRTQSDLPAFLCQKASLDLDVSKMADNSWSGPALFVSRSALKRHMSTVVQFSLDVNYVSQQVNMPLLRLLHQITSMYKNAKQTQKGLRDKRPSALHGLNASMLPHYNSELFPDRPYQQPSTSSISEDHEHGTLSSLGGKTDQRDSIGSSLSLRATPPPAPLVGLTTVSEVSVVTPRPASPVPPTAPSTSSNVSSNKLGRPQSFAQRLRSSTKLGKGYMNFGLERSTHSPLLGISISSSGIEGATVCSDKSPPLASTDAPPVHTSAPAAPSTPRCWRNVYCLLDLYTTTPETKTLSQAARRRYYKDPKSGEGETTVDANEDAGVPLVADRVQVLSEGERTPLVVLGVAKIRRTRLLASLSGLKLEAQMTGLQSSLDYKEKVRDDHTNTELSVTGHVDTSSIVLLEGNPQQTVVRVSIARSQALYSSLSRKAKERNSALISIGDIEVRIPQHPVILHDMMTRGTKQLSSTLQELRVTRPPPRLSRGATIEDPDASPRPHHTQTPSFPPQPHEEPTQSEQEPATSAAAADPVVPAAPRAPLMQPLVVQFSLVLQSVCVQAALLPSLQAQYRMEQLTCRGVTGSKAKFVAHLPTHRLSFSTKLQKLVSCSLII